MPTIVSITSADYIAWVQRSLNRIFHSAIITDGLIPRGSIAETYYRQLVTEFNFTRGFGETSEVGSPQQDALIKTNYKTPEYVRWIQFVLVRVGTTFNHPVTGTMDNATRDLIRSFQAYCGLKDDGWVGAKTETALIRKTGGIFPPGHIERGPVPPPKRPEAPIAPEPIDPLPTDKRIDRVINAILYEIKINPQVYPATWERRRVACLMLKLQLRHHRRTLNGKRIDDEYISKSSKSGRTDNAPHFFVHGSGSYTFSGGYSPEDLAFSALAELRRRILRLQPADRTDQESIRKVALELDRDINGGLVAIGNVHNVHGDSSLAARQLRRWARDRQDRSESILSCYTKKWYEKNFGDFV
jgi:hypothetical protein